MKYLAIFSVAAGALAIPAKALFVSSVQAGTAEAVATSTRFYDSLRRGDSAGAASLLAPDAVILESGDLETRAEYLAHHIGADIEFAKAVPSTRTVKKSLRQGDVVWLSATSTSRGMFENRQMDLTGAELMVLSRSQSGWRIRGIHWSSHRNRN